MKYGCKGEALGQLSEVRWQKGRRILPDYIILGKAHQWYWRVLHDVLSVLIKLLTELHHVDAQRSQRLTDGRSWLRRASGHPHPHQPHQSHVVVLSS